MFAVYFAVILRGEYGSIRFILTDISHLIKSWYSKYDNLHYNTINIRDTRKLVRIISYFQQTLLFLNVSKELFKTSFKKLIYSFLIEWALDFHKMSIFIQTQTFLNRFRGQANIWLVAIFNKVSMQVSSPVHLLRLRLGQNVANPLSDLTLRMYRTMYMFKILKIKDTKKFKYH